MPVFRVHLELSSIFSKALANSSKNALITVTLLADVAALAVVDGLEAEDLEMLGFPFYLVFH